MTKLSRRHVVPILLFAALSQLVGCSKTPTWFIGSFEFDAEESFKPLLDAASKKEKPEPKKDEGMVGALKGLATVFAPLALAQEYGGPTVTISRDEIVTTKGGSGTVVKFEVYQLPDKDTVVIKTSENKIETWKRTNSGISQKATGDLDLFIPFKRK